MIKWICKITGKHRWVHDSRGEVYWCERCGAGVSYDLMEYFTGKLIAPPSLLDEIINRPIVRIAPYVEFEIAKNAGALIDNSG